MPLTHRQKLGLAGKLLLVIAPAFVTSYYSYHTAKFEADAKSASTNAKAEAGYQTLVDVVFKHEERIRMLEAIKTAPPPEPIRRRGGGGAGYGSLGGIGTIGAHSSGAGGGGASVLTQPVPVSKLVPLTLPRTLEQAQERMNMRQQQLPLIHIDAAKK